MEESIKYDINILKYNIKNSFKYYINRELEHILAILILNEGYNRIFIFIE